MAYRLPESIEKSSDYLRNGGFEAAKKRISGFKSRMFFCENDARKAFVDLVSGYRGVYHADVEFYENPRMIRLDPDGSHWRGRAGETVIDDGMAAKATELYSVQVLVTNLPFAVEDREDLRRGATADRVVGVYLEQYHSEKNSRIMKSGMGVDRVYLHKRQDAMVFVVSLATMMSNALDSLLPDKMTSNQMVDTLENGTVEYDRSEDTMRFRGSPGMKDGISSAMDAIGVEKRFLLGF